MPHNDSVMLGWPDMGHASVQEYSKARVARMTSQTAFIELGQGGVGEALSLVGDITRADSRGSVCVLKCSTATERENLHGLKQPRRD